MLRIDRVIMAVVAGLGIVLVVHSDPLRWMKHAVPQQVATPASTLDDPASPQLVGSGPVQKILSRSRRLSFAKDGYTLTTVADFEVEALVLGATSYAWDRGADLAQRDVVLGWGRMSRIDLARQLEISQRGRHYSWRFASTSGLSEKVVRSSTANIHVIGATDEIESELGLLRAGDVVRLKGNLVDASAEDGWRWESSTSRTDSGDGSSEILLVREIARTADAVDL